MGKRWVELTALLVKDDQIQTQVTLTVLESAGFKTTHAKTGNAGIEAYRGKPYDVVVVDINLPDMTGHDVINVISEHTAHQATIVALAGLSDPGELEKALSSGAHDVYQKSVDAHVLRAKFSRLALGMVEVRRGKQQVEDIEQRLNDTIATLNTCAANRAKELDGLRAALQEFMKQPPLLTQAQIEEIATQAADTAAEKFKRDAAEMAVEIIQNDMQMRVGGFIIKRFSLVVGALALSAVGWLAGRGYIKL